MTIVKNSTKFFIAREICTWKKIIGSFYPMIKIGGRGEGMEKRQNPGTMCVWIEAWRHVEWERERERANRDAAVLGLQPHVLIVIQTRPKLTAKTRLSFQSTDRDINYSLASYCPFRRFPLLFFFPSIPLPYLGKLFRKQNKETGIINKETDITEFEIKDFYCREKLMRFKLFI